MLFQQSSKSIKQTLKPFFDAGVNVLPFKKQLFSIVRLFNPPETIWNKLRFEDKFKVELNNGNFYINHYGNGIENGIFWKGLLNGSGEKQALLLWIKLASQAETIFDVGANLGIYSLVAKTVNDKARVFGFEPVGHIFEKFKSNCDLNGFDVHAVHAALSDTDGTAEIYIKPGGLTTASLNENDLRTQSEPTETIAFATFVESRGIQKADLMKIDVEGYEPQVLKGMKQYLFSMKPTIIIEILNDDAGNQIEEIVRKCGYLYFNIDEKKGAIRQPNLSVKGKNRHSRNFLLCLAKTAEQLKLNCEAEFE